ncbi:hypothetical protein DMB65_16105 [Flavobacterium cheongpyeongense]|uniref:Uncharacterized protein n=1 Tax=Flavobacterium cheongpyeongense TaxID=2212651 RepID=A0A2V4BLR9_9FLAO|nr:hypothetical protein DMB65_16105 [Flavobacterium cheongpyeongense]
MIVTSFELSNTFWLIIKCDVWLGKYTKSEFICWGVGRGNIFLKIDTSLRLEVSLNQLINENFSILAKLKYVIQSYF